MTKMRVENIGYAFFIMISVQASYVDLSTDEPIILEVNTETWLTFSANSTTSLLVEGLLAAKYVIFQVHTQVVNVTLSLQQEWLPGYTAHGNNIGIVATLVGDEQQALVYVKTTDAVNAVVMATTHDYKAPVPGGCNQVFQLDLDPNIQVTVGRDLMQVHFQYANVGTQRGKSPPRCEDATCQNRLSYEVYQYFLPSRDWSEEVYLQAIAQLVSLEGIRDKATQVRQIAYKKGPTMVSFASYPGQGVMYVVVVTEEGNDNRTHTVPYVPAATYTCDFAAGVGCTSLNDLPGQILATILGAIGLLLCVCGHRLFKTAMFTYGTLAFGIISYILIVRFTMLDYQMLLVTGCAGGVVGGILWLVFWCLAGIPVLSMIIPALLLGYIFSSLIFNLTPLGLLEVFNSEFNYGMAFTCGVLVLPVVLLAFTKKLSLLCCTVIGSFLVMTAVDSYLFSNVSYLVLNSIRKGAVPGYIPTLTTMPLGLTGILLLIGWACLALVGLIIQTFRERDRPDFPSCPYERYQERRHRRRQMAELAGERDMIDERSPLLQGHSSRRPLYRGGRRPSAPQFQETPPRGPEPSVRANMIDPL